MTKKPYAPAIARIANRMLYSNVEATTISDKQSVRVICYNDMDARQLAQNLMDRGYDVYNAGVTVYVGPLATEKKEAAKQAEKEARDAAIIAEYNRLADKVDAHEYSKEDGVFTSAWHAWVGAGENADLTAQEQGFETYSIRWYECVLGGFDTNMGEFDPEDKPWERYIG